MQEITQHQTEPDTSRTYHTQNHPNNEEDEMNTSTKAPDTDPQYNDVFEECMGISQSSKQGSPGECPPAKIRSSKNQVPAPRLSSGPNDLGAGRSPLREEGSRVRKLKIVPTKRTEESKHTAVLKQMGERI